MFKIVQCLVYLITLQKIYDSKPKFIFISYTHSLKGFKRDLYGSYLAMLKCVTQKVLIEKRTVKVLY